MRKLLLYRAFLTFLLSSCWGQDSSTAPPVPTPSPELLRPDNEYPFIKSQLNEIIYAAYLLPLWQELKANKRKIRVLHIGDSHIQGDIQGREIRHRLYKVWGPGGRGYAFPYHVAGTSSAYDYSSVGGGQWLSARSVQPNPLLPLGITGIALGTYDPTAYWEVRWHPAYQPAAPAGARVTLLTRTLRSGIRCILSMGGASQPIAQELPVGYAFTTITLPAPLHTLRCSYEWSGDDSLSYVELQGIFIEEGDKGITWYSMGIAGARLSDWATLPLLKESLRLLSPDLVVIDLGTNDLYASRATLWDFRRAMEAAIDTIRSALPNASILFTTPQDFYRSMRPLPMLAQASQLIRWIGAEKQVAIWDAYTVLGPLQEWRNAGLASQDMVHLTVAGYVLKGQLLASAFLRSYQRFLTDTLPSPETEKAGLQAPPEALAPPPPPVPITPSITQFGRGATPPVAYSPPRTTTTLHKVRAGETLGQIAQRYGTTVAAIQRANGLRGTYIRVGQVLKIPTAGTSRPSAPPSQKSSPASAQKASANRTHTVRPGESLWSIAQKYGVTMDALCRANALTPKSFIRPGQKLKIP